MSRFATDRRTLERNVRITFYRASGPGGQHRNKVETAVRIYHPSSGITVRASDHRSQSRNRELAFERLIDRLNLRNRRKKPRVPTKKSRAAVEKRLNTKRKRAQQKQTRRRPDPE